MPRPEFHATMPGFAAGGGPIAIILRVLMLGVALVVAFFFVCVAFVLGAFFLLLRSLGLGPKTPPQRQNPFAPFGAAFAGRHAQPGHDPGSAHAHEDLEQEQEPASQKETVKQLEEFHGSLDEFLKQRKDSNPS
ncbi:MAG: hypothetical protein GY747_12415 [Planctomycetes bacterium]|nr:hypothetical protein [Planctomycetota bacterium]MCP4771797.1 hypothetical protein [Planctomycetota bacterium]MCP4860960.1 hypothetical protein [Planctomycetota bacterium]